MSKSKIPLFSRKNKSEELIAEQNSHLKELMEASLEVGKSMSEHNEILKELEVQSVRIANTNNIIAAKSNIIAIFAMIATVGSLSLSVYFYNASYDRQEKMVRYQQIITTQEDTIKAVEALQSKLGLIEYRCEKQSKNDKHNLNVFADSHIEYFYNKIKYLDKIEELETQLLPYPKIVKSITHSLSLIMINYVSLEELGQWLDYDLGLVDKLKISEIENRLVDEQTNMYVARYIIEHLMSIIKKIPHLILDGDSEILDFDTYEKELFFSTDSINTFLMDKEIMEEDLANMNVQCRGIVERVYSNLSNIFKKKRIPETVYIY